MKKFLLASISFAALVAGPATAADLGRPAYRGPVVYAPAWTGLYVGGDIGGAWQNSQTFLFSDPGNAANNSCNQCSVPYQPEQLTAGGKSGLLGGFHVGYDYQGGEAFVLGAEWDFMWTSKINQSADAPLFSDATSFTSSAIVPVVNSSLHFENQTKWLTSLRGRAGWLVTPGLLAYGTGGIAWGRFDNAASASCVVPDPNGCVFNGTGAISAFSQRETKFGVVLGAGVEYQIPTTRLRARLEYLFYGFDPHETAGAGPWIATPGGGPLPCLNTPTCAANFNFGSSGNTNIQTLRVGISYAFGGYAAAPAVYR
jgi:outer membrane immunogenic protein